jgi:HEAT repeat protein
MNKKMPYIIVVSILFPLLVIAAYVLTLVDRPNIRDHRAAAVADEDKAIPDAGAKNVDAGAEPALGRSETRGSNTEAEPIATSGAAPPETAPNQELSPERQNELIAQFVAWRHDPPSDGIEILTRYLHHADRLVAAEALETLAFLSGDGDHTEAAIGLLKAKAADTSYALRGKALYFASMIAKDEMLPVVAGYIDNPDETDPDSSYITASLALVAMNSPTSIPYLDTLLKKAQDNPDARRNCYGTLAKINSAESLRVLADHVRSAKGDDQISGAVMMAQSNMPEVHEFLVEAIETQELSDKTIDSLAMTPAAPMVFESLLNSESLSDARKTQVLKRLADNSSEGNSNLSTEMTSVMEALLTRSQDPAIKANAIKVIGNLRDMRASEIITPYLQDENLDIRKEASFAFIYNMNFDNYRELSGLLWDENQQIRRTAMISLARYAGYDDIELLQQAVQHDDEFIRKQAEALLVQLQ